MPPRNRARPTTNGRFEMPPFFGSSDPIANANLRKLVDNVTTLRRDAFQNLLDPRRNINRECGYPDRVTDPRTYQDLFDWDAVASRVVECLPKETWQVQPEVYEDEDSETATDFEKAWDAIGTQLRGDSWYQEEESNPVWEYLLRADVLSGIGQYGCILLGLDDGELDLSRPVKGLIEKNSASVGTEMVGEGDAKKPVPKVFSRPDPSVNGGAYSLTVNAEQTSGRKLKFLRVFPESLAQITRFESNISCPRFGQPTMYLLTFNDPSMQSTGIGLPLASVNVHWTRVIHVADNLTSSEVFGVPRLRAVLRHILSLQKVYGGSAEGYWRSCFPAIVFQTHPQLGGDVNVDQDAMRAMMENFWNQLDRSITAMGMDVKTLPPQLVDPTPTIDKHIEAICIKLGIPVRVFKGSERGELASSQDDAAWNDRLKLRQKMYVTPRIVIPFVDRLIAVGVLPQPTVRKKKFDEGASLKVKAPAVPGAGGPGGTPKPGGKPGIPNKFSAPSKPPAPGAPPKQPQFNFYDPNQPRDDDGKWGDGGGGDKRTDVQKKYPHLAHLLNGIKTVETAGSKAEATAKAKALREKGEHAVVFRDPKGARGSSWLVANALDDEEQTYQKDGEPPADETPPNELIDAPPETSDETEGQGDVRELQLDEPRQEMSDEAPGYRVEWPDITSQTEAEKADVSNKKTTALAAYISGDVGQILPPFDFLTRIMGMSEDEAQATLQNAEEINLQKEQEDMEKQQELIDKGLIADPAQEQEAKMKAIEKGVNPNPVQGLPGAPPFGKPPSDKMEAPVKPPLEDKP